MTNLAQYAKLFAFNFGVLAANVATYAFLHGTGIASPFPFIAFAAVAFAGSFYLIQQGASGPYTGALKIVGSFCATAVVLLLSLAVIVNLWGS